MAGANPQMLIRIAANLEQLKKNLAEGKAQIEVTTAGMQKMAASLDGSKLEQRANNITAAINEVGGASKLTDAEARRLLPTLDSWIEKGQRMGKEIPPDILKTRDALKQIDDAAKTSADALKQIGPAAKASASGGTDLLGVLTKIGGAVGIAFSVGSIIQFGKSVFDSASQIGDLADQIGISTDAVQGFKSAAEQSGSTLDAVGTAITKMNANLSEGDKGTVGALKAAGLSFSDIRNMRPEDAFLTITDAIQKIPDPMTQTDVALKLFGKSAAELLPAIKDGFRDASNAADKMSKETIKSLKEAQDAWTRFGNSITIVSGEFIAGVEQGVAGMKSGLSKALESKESLLVFAENVRLYGIGPAIAMADAWKQGVEGTKQATDVYLGAAGSVRKTKEELDAATQAAKEHAKAVAEVADKYGGMAKKIGEISDAMKTMKPSDDWKGLAEDLAKLQKEGANLTPAMVELALKFGTLGPAAKIGADGITNLGFSFELAIPKLSAFMQAVDDLRAKTTAGWGGLGELGFKYSTGFEAGAKAIEEATKKSQKAIDDLVKAFTQLSTIAGGSLGDIIKSFGTLVAAINTAQKGVASFKAGMSAFKAAEGLGEALSGIMGMTTGIMGMASAAIAAGKAIASLFNRSKGRNLVEDFAASMGGFDALREQLNALGEEGERLWIALTQGVGKNNPKEAQAAIDAIIKALAKKQAASEASTVSTEAEAQATIETAAAATAALEEVSARLLTNRDDWKAWSEDVTGFLQKLADDIRGMPIPSPTSIPGGSSSGGGGGSASSRRSGGGSTSGRTSQAAASITVVSKLDGRVVARNQVRYIPGELMKAGR